MRGHGEASASHANEPTAIFTRAGERGILFLPPGHSHSGNLHCNFCGIVDGLLSALREAGMASDQAAALGAGKATPRAGRMRAACQATVMWIGENALVG